MTYELTYWNKRGRGEQVRLLLAELGQPATEVHVSGDSFRDLQAQGADALTFGSVPMLRDGAFKLCQGPVILSYLAKKHGLVPADNLETIGRADEITLGAEDLRIQYFSLFGDDGERKQSEFVSGSWPQRWLPALSRLLELNGDTGFFVGESITHADIAVWDVLDSITSWVSGASLSSHRRLEEFFQAIGARPRIRAYLDSDRRPSG